MATQPIGCRFAFSRDRTFKFVPSDKEGDARRPTQDQWWAAGAFDYLEIRPIHAFDELDLEQLGSGEGALDSYGDLVVFPLSGLDREKMAEVALGCTKHPLVVCTSITLSPPAYEFGAHYACVLATLQKMGEAIRREIDLAPDFPPTVLFQSLGGPDLVVVSLPQTPLQLLRVHGVIQKAKTLDLREIVPDIVVGNHWPGHACSVVEPILAIHPSAVSQFGGKAFREEEVAIGLRLRFMLRVECGHEKVVVADLVKNYGVQLEQQESGGHALLAWAPHTIHGVFRHLSDFARLLSERWYCPDWREANLIDSATLLFVPDERVAAVGPELPYPKIWRLRSELVQELEAMRAGISGFAEAFLGRAQRTELLAIFTSFESCFYRHEFLAAARDLFPFFRQVAKMFSCTSTWKSYLDTSVSEGEARNRRRDKFDNQMQFLLSCLSRAVRNRMEHRSFDANPFLPTTLEHGACKLVSAYTVVIWLCEEIFRRQAGELPGNSCDTQHFAACLCAGSEGRVVCQELFREFRTFVEHKHQGKRISEIGENGWTARPWLLEISGKSLLRPELCLVHCMHEVAELSDWIRTPRCDLLRFRLNKWILMEVVANARQIVRRSGTANATAPDRYDDAVELLVLWCILGCWKVDVLRKNPEDLLAAMQDLCQEVDPETLIAMVRKAIIESGFPRQPDEDWESPVPAFTSQFNNREFIRAIDAIASLVPEIIGDIGMHCALEHVLRIRGVNSRTPEQRFDDVNKVFESLLVAVMESRGPQRSRSRIEQTILHRWALQGAAVLQGDPSYIPGILGRLDRLRGRYPDLTALDELAAMLKKSAEFHVQFDEPDGLVSALRELEAYGGSDSLAFPGVDDLSSPIVELLDAFVNVWTTDGQDDARLQLALELWGQSERLGHERVLMAVGEPPHDASKDATCFPVET